MYRLEISLKRVQTFIFDVPRLKAMLGANALIGQTMRHDLPKLFGNRGKELHWPKSVTLATIPGDPLNKIAEHKEDQDHPDALFQKGILARDGGHFIALFQDVDAASDFLREAEERLAEWLPGVLYDARVEPFPSPKDRKPEKIDAKETEILDLPVLQVCQETGSGPASDPEKRDGQERWQASSVTHRLKSGGSFYAGETKDITGLLRPVLYPDKAQEWREPDDLAQLAAGGYLALIHADGNGIGKRYNDWIDKAPAELDDVGKEAYGEAFFQSMRVAVRRALVDALSGTFVEKGGKRPYEVLMLGGDDLLLVCRADKALLFAKNYSAELAKYELADKTEEEDGRPLHVAIGVAIAQKTYPVHRLNELAESLASSAKRLYRALPKGEKASVIDWQVVTQSWFEGVAEARRQSERLTYTVNGKPETLLLTGRPYRVPGAEGLEGLLDSARGLDGEGDPKAARSPLRSLRGACERGRLMGEMTFQRLDKGIQPKLGWEKGELWKKAVEEEESIYATRALDIVGIWEIGRLGRKKRD